MSINFRPLTSERKLFDNENKANYSSKYLAFLHTYYTCRTVIIDSEGGGGISTGKTKVINVIDDKHFVRFIFWV